MDELMQTAGRYIGRFWTDIAGAGESEEVADVARALAVSYTHHRAHETT